MWNILLNYYTFPQTFCSSTDDVERKTKQKLWKMLKRKAVRNTWYIRPCHFKYNSMYLPWWISINLSPICWCWHTCRVHIFIIITVHYSMSSTSTCYYNKILPGIWNCISNNVCILNDWVWLSRQQTNTLNTMVDLDQVFNIIILLYTYIYCTLFISLHIDWILSDSLIRFR